MISTVLMGGLGNQLFQIFNVIAYSLRYNKTFTFEYSDKLKVGIERSTYWNNFLSNLKQYTTTTKITLPQLRERGFHYTQIPQINQNFMFNGYYQSYKYFEDEYDNIIKLIDLKKIQDNVVIKYNKYFIDCNDNHLNLISMHFRLGDYKEKQEYHPVMTIKYYQNALKHIINKSGKEDWTILYFCEKDDNDIVNNSIKNLQNTFPIIQFIKVDDNIPDWEQMIMMSCCKHNIIANSTFSWWGAYFNANQEKITCYPNIWFGPAMGKKNLNDLFPTKWNKIKTTE
jgi:hypothetical protein